MKYRGIMLVLFLVCSDSWGDQSPRINFNPFEYADEKKASVVRKSGQDPVAKVVVKPRPWKPPLIATIIAGENSMANVAGKVVKIGQKIDGYTLVSVEQKSATFEKSGNKYKIKMAKRAKAK